MKIRAISMVLALAILTVGSSGCLKVHEMALVKGQDMVDVSNESVGLLYVKVSNQYKHSCQPKMVSVMYGQNVFVVDSNLTAFSMDSQITGRFFDVKDPYRNEKDGFNEYLLTLRLKPGNYDYICFMGEYKIPLLISAQTYLCLKTQVEVKPNAVIYLGHIDAAIRERKSDAEVRAGSIYSLVDQSASGFSNGTYDVSIEDRFNDDIKLFTAEYPGLQKARIEKAVIPPSTRVVEPPDFKILRQMGLHRN
jgi:hypothetical protein